MHRAVELSKYGFPAPNPHVGCVIVKENEVVGEGWHEFVGGPHAEVMALEQAKEKAEGADVYVTLEPCNHWGRTGPCSEALIRAAVRRVYVACTEPHSVAKGGLQKLQEAGIEAFAGILHSEARQANLVWYSAMEMGRPFVCAKAATTLDGRIALPSGESKWITSDQAREDAHFLRAEMGAVLVGCGTVLADDPQLTVRVRGVHEQPVRIVLDPSCRLTGSERIFQESRSRTVWIVGDGNPLTHPSQIALNIANGEFDLQEVLAVLWDQKLTSVLVEGGGKTIARFLNAGLVDRIDLFVAPKVFGDGPSWVSGLQAERLADVRGWEFEEPRKVGQDLWIRAYPSAK